MVGFKLRIGSQRPEGHHQSPADALVERGPCIPIELSTAHWHRDILIEDGLTPPESLTELAMFDTGASNTCIDEAAARRAGLPIKGWAFMDSASHAGTRVPVFTGQIQSLALRVTVETALGVNMGHFHDAELIVLIGRDVMRQMVFTYNGPEGSISASA